MANALPREAAVAVESTFGVGPVWTGAGLAIKVIEPEAELVREQLDNENITPRRLAVLDQILGLKSTSTVNLAIYGTASGVNAADQQPAVATVASHILHSGLGGRTLGFRAALAGTGTVTIPNVVTDPGYVNGMWVFAFDDSEGTGGWHRIEDASATPALTISPDLPLGPDAADIFYAAIMIYPHELAMDHTSAGYTTLSWLFQGEHVDDVFELLGCKPTIGIEGLAAGELLKFSCAHNVLDWPDVQPAKQVLAGTPSGIAPLTVGSGVQTTIKLADFGTPLVDVDCRGTTDIDPGVTWGPVSGACGTEGVKGWVSEITAATITIRLAFADPSWDAKYEAGTKQHLLISIGDKPTNAVGIYFGNLEFAARPKRINEAGVTTTELMFRSHEDPADTTGLTGDDLALRRAPFVLLFAA